MQKDLKTNFFIRSILSKNVFESKANYLFTLKTKEGIPLHKFPRRTFVIGFALTIKSVLSIAEEMLTKNYLKYLFTTSFKII